MVLDFFPNANLSKMKNLCFILIFFSSSAWALGYRHLISFGTNGLGWSGAVEDIDTKSSSDYKQIKYFYENVGINYAYLINQRIQLGVFFQSTQEEHKFIRRDNHTSTSELNTDVFGFFSLYNFSDEISDSYYGGVAFSVFNSEEENSHDLSESEGKKPFELDDTGNTYELVFGKRINLKRWNIEHLSFSPQISIYYRTHAKDFNDQKTENGVGIKFWPIKFDFLF